MLDNLTRRLGSIFSGIRKKGRLTEDDVKEVMREIRVALLEADVNFQVAKEFMARVKEKAVGEEVFGSLTADQTIVKIVRDELVGLLGPEETPMNWGSSPPAVILMCGLQGSGKTTTTAKLAVWMKARGKKPLLAACDLQRPAAIKQLQVLGEQVDCPVFAGEPGGDPVQVAKDALARAKHLFCDVLILDTAGRLAIDEALMQELAQVKKAVPPNEVFLVVDSTTGQEAVNVAQAFHERLGVTGAIFTKMDGDARGGAVLSVREATGVPVRFLGVGEQTEALDAFQAVRMAERIIGMGDVMGIIEKAEQAFANEDVEALESRMRTGKLDFHDFLDQMRMVRKMGPIKNVMKMIPGVASQIPEEALDSIDDRQVDRLEAIVLSMTPKERSNPDILNGSRRKRIALGSGTSVQEVNKLVEQLYGMRRGMKEMAKMQKQFKKFRR
ncbi:MAG: signal recognition particle protein [Armatimonadetes bacterium]|nr:signal recognition particle protein [Armatimonadota bacterium]MBS1711830.1 signal recognition particle protein [Armatimonadota bacterium]MBX3109616.1 signal recognition particle protein [Fimbriimonadaceae bacterium]